MTDFTACGLNRINNWPDTQGSSIAPIEVAEKNIPVFFPERCICFSAYIISDGKINAMKSPIPIVPAHKTPFECGNMSAVNTLRILPVKETIRILSAPIQVVELE